MFCEVSRKSAIYQWNVKLSSPQTKSEGMIKRPIRQLVVLSYDLNPEPYTLYKSVSERGR
jgi:hypothetical protein